MRRLLTTAACALAAGSLVPWAAHAALGGDEASVIADAAQMHAGVRAAPRADYDLESISGSSGAEVREYLSRGGLVFAVAWSGPAPPDLGRLLGGHFAEYASALAALRHPGLHRTLAVTTASGLVVEAGGHLRAYAGRAYLRALVPAGVNPAELR